MIIYLKFYLALIKTFFTKHIEEIFITLGLISFITTTAFISFIAASYLLGTVLFLFGLFLVYTSKRGE